jgi:uncharacterized protein YjhX (UPF0386 family)
MFFIIKQIALFFFFLSFNFACNAERFPLKKFLTFGGEISYQYEHKQRFRGVVKSNDLGSVNFYYVVSFRNNGTRKKATMIDNKKKSIVSVLNFDQSGRLKKIKNDNQDCEYDYNVKKQIKTIKCFKSDGSLEFSSTLVFKKGLINKMENFDSKGGVSNYTIYDYKQYRARTYSKEKVLLNESEIFKQLLKKK